MSGYLRRLAARSLQAAPAVHPAVRLPYAPLPADDAPMAAAAVPGAATLPVPPSAPPRRASPRDADPHPPFREVEPPGDPRPSPAARRPAALPLPPMEEREMDEPASRPARLPFIPLVVEPAPVATGARDAGRGSAIPSAATVSTVSAVEVASPPTPQGARAERDGPSVVATSAPVPTLPRGAAERAAAARVAADEGPAVVEVRIGRIEIAAPPPPPAPPRRPAAPERRPMTLSEYLERRRGRGR